MKIDNLYPTSFKDKLKYYAFEKTKKTFKDSKIKKVFVQKHCVIVKLEMGSVQWNKQDLITEMKDTNTKQI